jgi:hypothetical protein
MTSNFGHRSFPPPATDSDNTPPAHPPAPSAVPFSCPPPYPPATPCHNYSVKVGVPSALERDNNPAALVILAHRAAQERRRDPVQRQALKWALTRSLYERGYRKEDILELFRLIDWLVRLPQEQEVEFRRQVAEYEAQKHMPYITSIERLGREEGRRQGAIITRQHAVLDALEIRFGEVADAIRQRIEAIQDEAQLRALLKSAIQVGSIEEFTQSL